MAQFVVMICWLFLIYQVYNKSYDYFSRSIKNNTLVMLNTVAVVTGFQFAMILLCWLTSKVLF